MNERGMVPGAATDVLCVGQNWRISPVLCAQKETWCHGSTWYVTTYHSTCRLEDMVT